MAEPGRGGGAHRRAGLSRQRAAVGALGGGLCARSRAHAADARRARRRRGADRKPTPRASRRSARRRRWSPATSSSTSAFPTSALALGRELRRASATRAPVWVAGSTRDGEEALILDALAARRLPAGALTVIVPRHPQRFDAVAELLRERGIPFVAAQRQRAGAGRHRASCSATRWASCSATTRRPTSRSSAAACCRWADRT